MMSLNGVSRRPTTYIVSGYMRSGTSITMRAIAESSDLEVAQREEKNNLNERYGDRHYKPNADGFYELQKEDFRQFRFPEAHEGKLIKVLAGGLLMLWPMRYRVVFLCRDPEEIRESWDAFFMEEELAAEHYMMRNRKQIEVHALCDFYADFVDRAIAIGHVRQDIELTVIDYRDLVNNPLDAFSVLKGEGWPIDPVKAASFFDRSRYRFRREDIPNVDGPYQRHPSCRAI